MAEPCTRRTSIKTVTLTGAAAGLSGMAATAVVAGQENTSKKGETVKVALVGCGGRGKGDLNSFMNACDILDLKAEVVALADVFKDALKAASQQFDVPDRQCYSGFDAYRKVAMSDAQYVLLITPPLFRPLHLEAMLKAGKHVFIEKPCAVDAPGCRKVIELGELATSKGLGISAGMQRRHDAGYLKNKQLIDAGAIGEILGGVVSWNGTVPWIKERRPGSSDAEYLAGNWLNWVELSGDHICEQHVHNLDVANWFIGRPPVSAVGFGGRARRESGNQYDFFSADLDYGDNVHIHSQCRQISGCFNRVGEELRGSKGVVFGGGKLRGDSSIPVPEIPSDTDNESIQQFIDMIRRISSGNPLNEARTVAEATATAVMARIAAYTGKMVRWSDLMQNDASPWYNYTCDISAEDFEKGNVNLPPENTAPIPGDGKPIRRH